ncbi:MAG: gliding motility lipoprotein GldH [Bacteroidales bacterium]|jgi:gliding motility-associated lipoprotein GldH|nr:gliding motility lipoprotein GldH [Bacteroidales bacterium]
MRKFIVPFVWIIVFFSCSCTHRNYYHEIYPIHGEVWNIDSVLHFNIDIIDSLQYFDFYIDIRNNTDFETQNFYIFLTSEFPNGYIGTDTLGFVICNPFGKWTGKGNSRIKENRFTYKTNIRFSTTGTYKFSVLQGMRKNKVKGITDFGLCLTKSKNDH